MSLEEYSHKTIVKLGVGMMSIKLSVLLVMFSAGFIVQFYLKEFGPSAAAAYGVALRVEQLFLLPVFGLTGALLPIASQNFGAGEAIRVRKALFTCWKFGWIFMFAACPILYFAAPMLMRSLSCRRGWSK